MAAAAWVQHNAAHTHGTSLASFPPDNDSDLEGPWNNYEEFLAASVKREQQVAMCRQTASGKKKKGKKPQVQGKGGGDVQLDPMSGRHGATFALTTTGASEDAVDQHMKRSHSSMGEYASSAVSSALMHSTGIAQRASTSLGTHSAFRVGPSVEGPVGENCVVTVDLCNAATQCRPMEMEQEPVDRILRRYAFSLEWDHGSLGPGLLNSANDAAPKGDAECRDGGGKDVGEHQPLEVDGSTEEERQIRSLIVASVQDGLNGLEAELSAHAPSSVFEEDSHVQSEVATRSVGPMVGKTSSITSGPRPRTSQASRPPRDPGIKRSESPVRDNTNTSVKAESSTGSFKQIRCRKNAKPSKTGEESNLAQLSSSTFSSVTVSGLGRSKTTPTPNVGMRFYEVKLTEKESDPPVDYSVDFRRYSYTDFKIPERGDGTSTTDPEQIADWIDRAVPRNQDDAHPLFVLCKDLLRKFHQKEIRYAVRKEQDMLVEITALHEALLGDQARTEVLRQQKEEEAGRIEEERRAMEEYMKSVLEEMDALSAELARYKKLHAAMNVLRATIRTDLKEDLERLKLENGNLLHELDFLWHAKDLERDKVLNAAKQQFESQLSSMTELQAECDAQRTRANEAEAQLLLLQKKTPMQHVAEWNFEARVLVLKHFFRPYTVKRKIQNIEAADLANKGATGTDEAEVAVEAAAEQEQHEEVMEQVAASMSEDEFVQLPEDLKFKFTRRNIAELKMAVEKGTGMNTWLDIVASLLGVKANGLWKYLFELIKGETSVWSVLLLTHKGGQGEAWVVVRDALADAKIKLDSLAALEILSGVEKMKLLADIVGLDPKYIPMIRENWGLFLQWFARFGANADGLDEAEEELLRIKEKVKKYSLFDLSKVDAQPLSLEDTLKYIGEMLDFKFESDWENEGEQRPRLNMVRAIKSFMLRKLVNKRAADEQTKRFCASVLKWGDINARVKVFGICSGMIEILSSWTERATCIYMLWLQELKKLSSPGLESQDPSTLGQSWVIFAPWLGTADKVVELEHVVAACTAAMDSDYGFGVLGDSRELLTALTAAVAKVPGMTAGLSIDKAAEIFMQAWLALFQNAKTTLIQIFDHFDENNDQSLDMQEFLVLLKSTPLKIRQHDAMNMFNELAGPDGTMDDSEFSEILVFYKFNTRGLLDINLKTAKAKALPTARS